MIRRSRHTHRAVTWAISIAGALALAGCGGPSGSGEPAAVSEGDVSIPTAEEAAASATAEITAENADAAFDELMREIEADAAQEG